MAEFTKERIIEELKASTQNASGMFEISEDTICNLMSMLTTAAPQLPQPAVVGDVSIQKAAAWLDGVMSSSPGMKEPVTCRAAMLMLSARRNGQKFGC